jgi:N-methylhydantoinase B
VPERITKAERVAFAPGDRILLESPGGGGHGTPAERDPERVRADVANELIDAATARDVYGLLPEAEA